MRPQAEISAAPIFPHDGGTENEDTKTEDLRRLGSDTRGEQLFCDFTQYTKFERVPFLAKDLKNDDCYEGRALLRDALDVA